MRATLIADEKDRAIKILTSAVEQSKFHKHAAVNI